MQTKHYIWGNDLSGSRQGAHSAGSGPSAGGVGGLLAATSTASSTPDAFFHFDANGNVIALSDATGNESATYEYSAFGDIIASTGPAAFGNPFRFSTKYEDTESGFLYYGYRSYDPETGRWLNRDPIRESGGLNVYAFVGNGGNNNWDLLGLCDVKEPGCVKGCEAELAAGLADASATYAAAMSAALVACALTGPKYLGCVAAAGVVATAAYTAAVVSLEIKFNLCIGNCPCVCPPKVV